MNKLYNNALIKRSQNEQKKFLHSFYLAKLFVGGLSIQSIKKSNTQDLCTIYALSYSHSKSIFALQLLRNFPLEVNRHIHP